MTDVFLWNLKHFKENFQATSEKYLKILQRLAVYCKVMSTVSKKILYYGKQTINFSKNIGDSW